MHSEQFSRASFWGPSLSSSSSVGFQVPGSFKVPEFRGRFSLAHPNLPLATFLMCFGDITKAHGAASSST